MMMMKMIMLISVRGIFGGTRERQTAMGDTLHHRTAALRCTPLK